jgi:hypothetical protein
MQTIERGGYTREEILSVLHSKNSARHVKFRYDLLDKNEYYKKTLGTVVDGEVAMSAFSTIKRTAKFNIKEQYIPEHIEREEKDKSQGYDSDFSGWSGQGSVPISGAVKISSPAVSHAPEWGMNTAGSNGVAQGWQGWGSTHGDYYISANGLTAGAQACNKTSTVNASFGIQTSSNNHLSVGVGDYIYLSFFYWKPSAMPNPTYIYAMTADGQGNWNFNTTDTAFEAYMYHTELGGGWWRCDTRLRAQRTTTCGILIANYTNTTGILKIENVYFNKNVSPIYNAEAISPVMDLSDSLYFGNDVPRLVNTEIEYDKTYGSYNSAETSAPMNEFWSRFSLDGGSTWSDWQAQGEYGIVGLDAGTDISNLRVQFKWTASRYYHEDYVALNRASVTMTYERDIIVPETTEINYLSDRIQPFMEIKMPDGNWIDFPLGVFILSTPTRHDEVNGVYREIEAYDGLVILDEDKFTSRYNIPDGTKYTKAVEDILKSAGITKFNIEEKDSTLSSDIEFKIGTSKLEAVNKLLSSINYTPIWVDARGYFTAYQYVSPADRAEDYEYMDDELSVIYTEMEEELDLYGVPNVWVVTQSNPEKTPLVSKKTNSSEDSPTSTVNLGRNIVDFREVNDISDQATLNSYVERIAFEASQVFGKLKFKTALMPFHEYSDVYRVKYDALKIDYKFSETAWKMSLKAGGEMEHEVRRVVNI